jgi:hypothetical protein
MACARRYISSISRWTSSPACNPAKTRAGLAQPLEARPLVADLS